MIAVTILRCLALIFSSYGYIRFFRKKLPAEIAVAMMMASVGAVMFMAGILNILAETAAAVFLFGCVLAVLSILRCEKIKDVFTVGTAALLVFCAYFAVTLYGMKFSHYDNFSHWALVSKSMIENDRFPSFLDTNISFTSYPPGSAAFIYYGVKITGIRAEWMQMYAQTVLIFSMVTTVFAPVDKRKGKAGYLLALASSVILAAGNTSFADLLVDTLLPVVALAAIAACVCVGHEPKASLWISIPFNLFLMGIKNSGIFFVLVILAYVFVNTRRDFKKNRRMWTAAVLSPLALLLLWKKHVGLVFAEGMKVKHDVSFRYYRRIFSQKSMQEILAIGKEMAKKLFAPSDPLLFLLVFLIIAFVVVRLVLREKCETGRCLIPMAMIGVAAYLISLFGMYVFSMPGAEAARLAAWDRYYKTILIFACGMVTFRIILRMNTAEQGALKRASVCLLALLCGAANYFTVSPNMRHYLKGETDERRTAFERLIEKYDVPAGKSYIVVQASDDSGMYLDNLTKYLLCPQEQVSSAEIEWFEADPEGWRDYDYIIVACHSEAVEEYMSEHFENSEVIDLAGYK